MLTTTQQHLNKLKIKKLPASKIPLITGVSDTGDQPLLSNISANFRKNSKWPRGIRTARGKLVREKKPDVEKLVSETL